MKRYSLLTAFLFSFLILSKGQEYDILIKNGHVIDPKNQIDEVMDIGITGEKIAKIAADISPDAAKKTIDADGLIVTPGLIDIHGHHFFGTVPHRYLSNSFTALPPDGFTFRAGVTTVADAGGAGWRNFRLFKEQVIDRSATRVLAFINIVGDGMSGVVPNEQDQGDMDAKMTAMVARQFPEIIGVKIAIPGGHKKEPIKKPR